MQPFDVYVGDESTKFSFSMTSKMHGDPFVDMVGGFAYVWW